MDDLQNTLLSLLQEQDDNEQREQEIYTTGNAEEIAKYETQCAEDTFAQHRLADKMNEAGSLEQQRIALFKRVDEGELTKATADSLYQKLIDHSEIKRIADRDARTKEIEEISRNALAQSRFMLEAGKNSPLMSLTSTVLPVSSQSAEDTDDILANFAEDDTVIEINSDSSSEEDTECETQMKKALESARVVPPVLPITDDIYWEKYRELLATDEDFVEFIYTEYNMHLLRTKNRKKRANYAPQLTSKHIVLAPAKTHSTPTKVRSQPVATKRRLPIDVIPVVESAPLSTSHVLVDMPAIVITADDF